MPTVGVAYNLLKYLDYPNQRDRWKYDAVKGDTPKRCADVHIRTHFRQKASIYVDAHTLP